MPGLELIPQSGKPFALVREEGRCSWEVGGVNGVIRMSTGERSRVQGGRQGLRPFQSPHVRFHWQVVRTSFSSACLCLDS
jgi:hypothetical protein